jgi:hypothetical protein
MGLTGACGLGRRRLVFSVVHYPTKQFCSI